jgi:hypothetical protein
MHFQGRPAISELDFANLKRLPIPSFMERANKVIKT